MDKYPSLTKTCSNCGLEKPLSAFLQMTGTEGTTYSNICASCRKTLMGQPKTLDSDDSTRSKSDHGIDSKVKVAEDKEKKEYVKKVEEEYHKERDVDEEKQIKKEEKTQTISKDEKKHRDIIKREKQSIFDNRAKAQPFITSTPAPEQIAGGAAQLAKENEINVSEAPDARAKYASSVNYERMKAFYGPGSGIMGQLDRRKLMEARANAKNNPAEEKDSANEKEETLSETVKRTFNRK